MFLDNFRTGMYIDEVAKVLAWNTTTKYIQVDTKPLFVVVVAGCYGTYLVCACAACNIFPPTANVSSAG